MSDYPKKLCRACGWRRSLDDFAFRRDSRRKGLYRRSTCIECERGNDKARMRKNRAERPEKFNSGSFRKTTPLKNKARRAVRYAVRTGKLTKPKHCEDCGKKHVALHGHHENYRKPLQVDWLCPDCHAVRHRKLKV